MCYEEFCIQYSFNPPFTLYYGIVSRVKKLNLFYNPDYITINLSFYPKSLEISRKSSKGSKDFYNIFIDHIWRKPKYEIKWERRIQSRGKQRLVED